MPRTRGITKGGESEMSLGVGRTAFGAGLVALVAVAAHSGAAPGPLPASRSPQARWIVTDLGVLSGEQAGASALNERGQIVGAVRLRGPGEKWRAFLWQNGKARLIGTVGPPGDGDTPNQSSAHEINERGQIIGNSHLVWGPFRSWAFLWQNGRIRPLFPRGYAYAWDLNERGQIVGFRGIRVRAFVWQNGRTRDLGGLPGRPYSIARGVNERGQIVGSSGRASPEGGLAGVRAFLWENGRMRDLGAPAGMSESDAIAINERGQVIGTGYDEAGSARAFVWQKGTMIALAAPNGGKTFVTAINNRGQVIGEVRTNNFDTYPYLWQNRRMTRLRGLATALAINERGQILGWRATEQGPRAVVWEDGRVTDLGTLGGQVSNAVAINDRGQIVGSSETRSGETHAVLWTMRAAQRDRLADREVSGDHLVLGRRATSSDGAAQDRVDRARHEPSP
jgi:probable HAF family extracellular repeat protein